MPHIGRVSDERRLSPAPIKSREHEVLDANFGSSRHSGGSEESASGQGRQRLALHCDKRGVRKLAPRTSQEPGGPRSRISNATWIALGFCPRKHGIDDRRRSGGCTRTSAFPGRSESTEHIAQRVRPSPDRMRDPCDNILGRDGSVPHQIGLSAAESWYARCPQRPAKCREGALVGHLLLQRPVCVDARARGGRATRYTRRCIDVLVAARVPNQDEALLPLNRSTGSSLTIEHASH